LLGDSHPHVRAAALAALADVETAEAEQALLAALGGKTGTVPATDLERASAASALAERKSAASRSALLSVLTERNADPGVVASAAEALGEIGGDPATATALVTAIRAHRSPNEPDVEVAALEALGKLEAKEGEAAAREAMASAQLPVRQAGRALYVALFGDADGAARAAAAPGPPAWKEAPLDSFRRVEPLARRAYIYTARGEIEVALFPDDAPRTVANFVRLAERGYFDRRSFHRVVPNFVVQDGDPTGTGWGGPGYAIRCEYNRRRYRAGALGMALAGKDTGGSQWFITHSPQPHLDGRYTIFGQVTEGFEFLSEITLGDSIERIRIER
jgi:cyclophilin family peptidyl-prolyl cis-trans isomerase